MLQRSTCNPRVTRGYSFGATAPKERGGEYNFNVDVRFTISINMIICNFGY